jgi:hypothetical protein
MAAVPNQVVHEIKSEDLIVRKNSVRWYILIPIKIIPDMSGNDVLINRITHELMRFMSYLRRDSASSNEPKLLCKFEVTPITVYADYFAGLSSSSILEEHEAELDKLKNNPEFMRQLNRLFVNHSDRWSTMIQHPTQA